MLKRIYIEISNICNLHCSFCPIDERKGTIMELSEFERILAQAAPMAEEICLHLMGEPLAHPKIKDIFNLCERYQTQVQLTTNGLLIKRYQDVILQSPVIRQVNFSVQSFRDNFPNRALDGYLKTILDFVRKGHEIRPELFVNLRLWNQDSEASDNSEIFEYVETYFGIEINRNVEVGAIKSKRIWNRLYLHFDSRFEWPSMNSPVQSTQGRCNGVIDHVGVLANGTVVPCCLDDKGTISLGNCLEEPIAQILSNERTNAMRNGFKNGRLVEDLCQRCTYINRFR